MIDFFEEPTVLKLKTNFKHFSFFVKCKDSKLHFHTVLISIFRIQVKKIHKENKKKKEKIVKNH